MNAVAQRRFGPQIAPAVVKAWIQFSDAFRQFPFNQSSLYSAPLQTVLRGTNGHVGIP